MRTAENRLFEGSHYTLDFFSDNHAEFKGAFDDAVRFINENQIYDRELWARFVHQFDFAADADGRWRCEYWGKMMRGACFVCDYTKDEALYAILEESVRELLKRQDFEGRFSTYPRDSEFRDWDMWGRKYIMLGLLYFYEICDNNELREEIMRAVCAHADYICGKVGQGDGKIPVQKTSTFWIGVNSMSILEPFVKLWNFTHNLRYLDFAAEIVREGYESEACIFKLAEENLIDPYLYPENKAYETMSCFDGLAEYYCATGIEKYRTAVINFTKRLLFSDVSVIGCCGCSNESFDHCSLTQINDRYRGLMQETCVTVTLIKLCGQLLRLTGDPIYADCIENSFFNAYLGALNTHKCLSTVPAEDGTGDFISQVLPFDSYSPLRAGARGAFIGGLNVMTDRTIYGCCACIGAAGAGYIPKIALLTFEGGVLLNLYLPGHICAQTPLGQTVGFDINGNYPYENRPVITISQDRPEYFTLDLRIPAWSRKTAVVLNGKTYDAPCGRFSLTREWKNGDTVSIDFDMNVYAQMPEKQCDTAYVSYRYGCIVLASDEKLAYQPDKPIRPLAQADGRVAAKPFRCKEIPEARVALKVQTADGPIELIDYASCGKDYGEKMAAWLPKASE